jgi:hypothetical protein
MPKRVDSLTIHSYCSIPTCSSKVYNEQVKDLLSTEPTPIKIQHDPKSGHTLITGVKEPVVVNPQQIISLLKAGEAHRHVGSTVRLVLEQSIFRKMK